VSISSLSDARSCPENLPEKIVRFRRLAYVAAAASGAALVAATPLLASFFMLENVDIKLLGLQGLVLALQIANGFHAALMIALQKSPQLWSVARNNTVLAAFLLPLCAWKLGAVGVALALSVVELFCAAQYVRLFHDASRFGDRAYAKETRSGHCRSLGNPGNAGGDIASNGGWQSAVSLAALGCRLHHDNSSQLARASRGPEPIIHIPGTRLYFSCRPGISGSVWR
ncbi:MAG TPA: hypothetical protein VFY78_03245, partial [Gammaproteobacteria bacterium]|nr:hypothetical protein [Gammaproteobacteria bacterium]